LPIARPNPHATAALSISPINCLRFILTLKIEEMEQFQKKNDSWILGYSDQGKKD